MSTAVLFSWVDNKIKAYVEHTDLSVHMFYSLLFVHQICVIWKRRSSSSDNHIRRDTPCWKHVRSLAGLFLEFGAKTKNVKWIPSWFSAPTLKYALIKHDGKLSFLGTVIDAFARWMWILFGKTRTSDASSLFSYSYTICWQMLSKRKHHTFLL